MSRPDSESGGFLGRWARLKQEAQRAPAVRDEASPATATPIEAGTLSEPGTPAESESKAADLPMPSLDSIVPGADVSAFFQAHVPEALRNAALRKVWSTDPDISGFIEMADYQWDFNNPDAIPGWGSSLDTSDIRRLAERLMGGGQDSTSQAMDIDALSQETLPSPDKDFPAGATTADASDASMDLRDIQPQAASQEEAAEDGAVQKTPSESVIYAGTKKRHGGALPS